MRKIFIVEDDEDIRELTIYALEAAGFSAVGFETGSDFFTALEQAQSLPELVLLDIMLPGEDGLSLLQRLRVSEKYENIAVIMLTAKGSEADRVKGLNFGADDYVVKPFGVTELIARINAVLRRARPGDKERGSLKYKELSLDSVRRTVSVGDTAVLLTFMEFELLHYMLVNQGIALSRDKIMNSVWGSDYLGESRTVDMHIKSLRHKLGAAGEYVKTVRSIGYKIGE